MQLSIFLERNARLSITQMRGRERGEESRGRSRRGDRKRDFNRSGSASRPSVPHDDSSRADVKPTHSSSAATRRADFTKERAVFLVLSASAVVGISKEWKRRRRERSECKETRAPLRSAPRIHGEHEIRSGSERALKFKGA